MESKGLGPVKLFQRGREKHAPKHTHADPVPAEIFAEDTYHGTDWIEKKRQERGGERRGGLEISIYNSFKKSKTESEKK